MACRGFQSAEHAVNHTCVAGGHAGFSGRKSIIVRARDVSVTLVDNSERRTRSSWAGLPRILSFWDSVKLVQNCVMCTSLHNACVSYAGGRLL